MSVLIVGGAAVGVGAAAALGVSATGALIGAGVAGAGLGGILSSGGDAPVSAAGGQQYTSESLYEKLLAQSDPKLASTLYARESNERYGRPAYARLEQQLMEDAIVGNANTVDADGYIYKTQYGSVPEGGKEISTEIDQYEHYVDSHEDLKTLFDAGGQGQSKAEFGQKHWREFGQREKSRTPLPEIGSVIDASGNVSQGDKVREYVGVEYAGQTINTGGVASLTAGNQERDAYDSEGNKITKRAGFDQNGNFQGTAQLATDVAFDTQQQNVQQELGLIEEYGTRATEAYRSQGDIRQSLNSVNALNQVSAMDGVGRSALHLNDQYSSPSMSSANQAANQTHKTHGSMMSKFVNQAKAGGNQTQGTGMTNPNTTSGLRNSMLSEAISGMNAGGNLTDRERRAATQSARSVMQARGRVNDFGGIMAELEMNEEYQRKRRGERQQFAGNVMNSEQGLMDRQTARDSLYQQGLAQDRGAAAQRVGLEQSTSADPYKAILNKDSGAGLAAGSQIYGSAASAKTASPNLYNPHVGMEFDQAAAANQDTYNASIYGADQAMKAGVISGVTGAAATAYAGRS